MSNKVKLYIDTDNVLAQKKLSELLSPHPEFELCLTTKIVCSRCHDIEIDINNPQSEAARVFNEFSAAQVNILQKRISDIFITVGIPAHIKGYQFLREAIKLTIEQPGIINCITKQLYPCVAKRFGTTPSKVERAIRHAIEVGWSRGKIENINNLFGVKVYGQHDRPTNGEFIALVADKMLIDGVVDQ